MLWSGDPFLWVSTIQMEDSGSVTVGTDWRTECNLVVGQCGSQRDEAGGMQTSSAKGTFYPTLTDCHPPQDLFQQY